MALGPQWKSQFGVPYVLDFQDPWLSDYYKQHPDQRPPGGKLKYGFSRWRAKRLEPPAVRGAAHIVAVSAAYPKMFQSRYPELPGERFTTLPFGAAESDFTFLQSNKIRQAVFNPHDGKRHWVYVGRGGADMALALTAFFQALNYVISAKPALRDKLRVHFIGTAYAPQGRGEKTVEPLAVKAGLSDIVSEVTDRIPYFEALQCLLDAEALFVPGSDDPGYTASKIYPYILAQKPLLAVFHAGEFGGGRFTEDQGRHGGWLSDRRNGRGGCRADRGHAMARRPGGPASGERLAGFRALHRAGNDPQAVRSV